MPEGCSFRKDGIPIWERSHNDGKTIPSLSSDDVITCVSIPLCMLVMVTIDCYQYNADDQHGNCRSGSKRQNEFR